jgi:tetratricopeptide (TPR) repeat protein
MNDVKSLLALLVDSVKRSDSDGVYSCLIKLVTDKPPLNSSWLGVAKMALLSGEINMAKQALELFVPTNQNSIAEKLQKLSLLIEVGQIKLAFEKGLSLAIENPTKPEINHFLSTVSLQLGNIELAIEYANKVLSEWPTSGQAWLILASAKKVQIDDPLVARIIDVKSAVLKTKNDQSISSFNAALSKVHYDLGEFELAFKYATKANDSLKTVQKYNSSEDQQNAQYIESQYVSSDTKVQSKQVASSENPIFVVGLPRSGTSLLEQMLCAHSNIIDGGEFNGMERAARCLTKGQPIGSHADHLDPNAIDKHVDTIRKAYLRYVHQKYGTTGAVVDKSMSNNRYLWLIKRVFPHSPIITIQRDVLDSAWSCYRTHFSSGFTWALNLIDTASYFSIEQRLSILWSNSFKGSLFPINYQQLVEQPEQTLKDLCEFSGLEYEDQMLDFYTSKRPVFTASVAQVRESIHQNAIGQGQSVKKQLAPFINNYKYTIE